MKNLRKKRSKNASESDKVHALLLLEKNDSNITETAKILDISYNTLYSWNKELGQKKGLENVNGDTLGIAFSENRQYLNKDQSAINKKFISNVIELKELVLMVMRVKLSKDASIKELVDILKLLHQIEPHKSEEGIYTKNPVLSGFLAQIYEDYPVRSGDSM